MRRIRDSPQYRSFIDQLRKESAGKNGKEIASPDFSQPIFRIISRELIGESYDHSELLNFFLKFRANQPVPGWSEIELHGVSIKGTEKIMFSLSGREFVIRQLDVPFFEREFFNEYGGKHSGHRVIQPDSILRIEMAARSSMEIQFEVASN